MSGSAHKARQIRARKIVAYLKKTYPAPKTELKYETSFQLVTAVVFSAQCTDKLVNKVTESLFKKYKTPTDFAAADLQKLTREISQLSFYRNKAKHIVAAAKIVRDDFGGSVPSTPEDLVKLPGVGYKTAHVVTGELFDHWPGIATDTHVKRFALKFDLTNETDPTKISNALEKLVPKTDWKYVNNGLVLYGRYVCKAHKHECVNHPLTTLWPQAAKRRPRAK